MRVHKNGCSPIHWREESQDTLNELKKKSNKVYSKDALTVAVDHYLECNLDEMRAALQAARNNLQKDCSKEIIKQIDEALGKR